jgi:hypothetical protein
MSNGRNLRFYSIPPNLAIESSVAAPPGQGHTHDFLSDGTRAAAMYRGRRKPRSEPQRRHDVLLHKSRYDPVTYNVASLEDISKTVGECRERARVAEADAEGNKKALASANNQVCYQKVRMIRI